MEEAAEVKMVEVQFPPRTHHVKIPRMAAQSCFLRNRRNPGPGILSHGYQIGHSRGSSIPISRKVSA